MTTFDRNGLFVFKSTYLTFKAERALKSAGIACKVVTKPRHISSDCGLAIRVAAEKELDVRTLMQHASIPFLDF